jgi:glycine cleavage system H protein
MAVIEKFLGQHVEMPENLRYDVKRGLWAKPQGQGITFGLTEPVLVLSGGFNDLDWLIPEGQTVQESEAIVFVITGKILYIDAPFQGNVHFNPEIKTTPSLVQKDPYGKGWLFRIKPDAEPEYELNRLVDAREYAESLKGTEGYKNPDGLKGGVSGICKAVYSGIREQKI